MKPIRLIAGLSGAQVAHKDGKQVGSETAAFDGHRRSSTELTFTV